MKPVAPSIEVVEADLNSRAHQDAIVELVDSYAREPMGIGKPLSADVRAGMIPGLREHPTTMVFLAYLGDEAIGIAVCFLGFSTFAARPLINIHDLAVLPAHRARGTGRQLLAAVERKALELGCCKLTLEVLDTNDRARRMYAAFGFAPMAHQQAAGTMLFLSKAL
jgi:GNAT superfamily N-acetyltransferase